MQRPGRVELKQFSNRGLFNGLKLPGWDAEKYLLGFGISKRPDHALSYIDNRYTVKEFERGSSPLPALPSVRLESPRPHQRATPLPAGGKQ